MARLNREESRALTREKLVASASDIFAREGYGGGSVDRIAENAGFSKGAFYSNFADKEEIFLEAIRVYSEGLLPPLFERLDAAPVAAMIDIVAEWANARASEAHWTLLVLEHVRHVRQTKSLDDRQTNLFRVQWLRLGERLNALFPPGQEPADAETLGALVFELTYGPAMGFSSGPDAGTLVRLALGALVKAPPA